PTGSGKSTALAAIVDLINVTHAKHIMTIEDPVEYVHADKLSRVEQREVGRDTPSFSRALRSVFRQSPDVVLVGEMRDVETIQTGQQAGMRTMNSSLAGLLRRRQITREDAEARSPDVKELRQLLAS